MKHTIATPPKKMIRLHAFTALIAILVLCVSCGDESPTSPTETSTSSSTTAAAPTISEEFSSTVTVGGSKFYSFRRLTW